MYQRALRGYKKALGPDHISILLTINSLDNLYKSQEMLMEAESMYQRTLAAYNKDSEFNPEEQLETCYSLESLFQRTFNLERAVKYFTQAYEGHREILALKNAEMVDAVARIDKAREKPTAGANFE